MITIIVGLILFCVGVAAGLAIGLSCEREPDCEQEADREKIF